MENSQYNRDQIAQGPAIAAEAIAAKRNLIPGSFIMVIIFFFCTFFDLKCVNNNGSLVSLNGKVSVTGIQMVTGTQSQMGEIPSSICAIIAFAAALTGAFVFIKKFKKELPALLPC
jgi:hypothetical protein